MLCAHVQLVNLCCLKWDPVVCDVFHNILANWIVSYQSCKATSGGNVRVSPMYSLVIALCAACVTALWLSPPQFSSRRSLDPYDLQWAGVGQGNIVPAELLQLEEEVSSLQASLTGGVDCQTASGLSHRDSGSQDWGTCCWLADTLMLQI